MAQGYTGAVLAGGASRRFGQDKALYPYRGKPLLLWVLESLGGAGERFIVAGRPYAFGVPVHPDLLPGGLGPLVGLYTALHHARFPWVAVAAVDLPFLSREYWDFLYGEAQALGVPALVPLGPKGLPEPLMGFYRKELEEGARRALLEGQRDLQGFLEAVGAGFLPYEEALRRFGPGLFLNANRPGDLP